MLQRAYKLLAQAYSELDAELLIDALDDDCVYESQHVFAALTGKEAIASYLRAKFVAIKRADATLTSSVRFVASDPVLNVLDTPCVVLCQGDTKAVVLLKLSSAGLISRIDLCIAPGHPYTAALV